MLKYNNVNSNQQVRHSRRFMVSMASSLYIVKHGHPHLTLNLRHLDFAKRAELLAGGHFVSWLLLSWDTRCLVEKAWTSSYVCETARTCKIKQQFLHMLHTSIITIITCTVKRTLSESCFELVYRV